ncbi:MAG: cytochrome c, partial [Planctomycetes bacterium]|nr:cytochrome c [Planctomycetota bacterium]
EFRVLESMRVAVGAVAAEWKNAPELQLEEGPQPETPEAIARGEALYLSSKSNCAQCHGADGKGRGLGAWNAESGWILRDVWGNPIRPADFTYGSYHGGGKPKEIYRSIALGIAGTPMPGYAGVLGPSEISDLTHYLLSLSDR